MDPIFEGESPRARLGLLLQHFSELKDDREPWRIVYPLKEVLLLVTCATIASCDDFDDIVAWGKHHLCFLRGFAEFHFGISCERCLAGPPSLKHEGPEVGDPEPSQGGQTGGNDGLYAERAPIRSI